MDMFSGQPWAGAGPGVVSTELGAVILDREEEGPRLDAKGKCKRPVHGWKLYQQSQK